MKSAPLSKIFVKILLLTYRLVLRSELIAVNPGFKHSSPWDRFIFLLDIPYSNVPCRDKGNLLTKHFKAVRGYQDQAL